MSDKFISALGDSYESVSFLPANRYRFAVAKFRGAVAHEIYDRDNDREMASLSARNVQINRATPLKRDAYRGSCYLQMNRF